MSKLIDLTGQTFGRWTVIKRAPSTPGGQTRWVCRCACGRSAELDGGNLRKGHTRTCRECRYPRELTGLTFGRLTVVKQMASSGRRLRWLCRCICGNKRIVQGNHLRGGAVVSCGCFRDEKFANAMRTHGQHGTAEYRSWTHIKDRCFNRKDKSFPNYGGRGITMCDRWRNSFEAFLQDMGSRPARTSLDRIDVNGHYEPGNCRWATAIVQARNKRNRK